MRDEVLSPPKKKCKKKKGTNFNLIANLSCTISYISETKYYIVKKAIKVSLGMKVVKEQNSADWDLFWTDNAVTP